MCVCASMYVWVWLYVSRAFTCGLCCKRLVFIKISRAAKQEEEVDAMTSTKAPKNAETEIEWKERLKAKVQTEVPCGKCCDQTTECI